MVSRIHFASLFLLPIALSTFALPKRWVWAISIVSASACLIAAVLGQPLPHWHGGTGDAFSLHKIGMGVNFAVSAGVILVFLGRAASGWRAHEQGLAILRERFARNEGIVALATHAASVAHELNTPLATLTLLVDELSEQTADPEQRREIEVVRNLVGQCRDRVKELASASSGSVGAAGVELESVIDRWRLIRPTVELVRDRSDHRKRKGRRRDRSSASRAPEQRRGFRRAGGRRRASTCGWSEGEELVGQVRDYGVGFEEAVPQLPGCCSGRTSLGAWASASPVSCDGRTPRRRAVDGRRRGWQGRLRELPSAGTGMNGLLVDDDVLFLQTLQRSLARRQVEAQTARDSAAALALAGAHDFDFALVDLKIDKESGLRLIAL